jgi:riboflavin biosynthesis pyrimidine reductase
VDLPAALRRVYGSDLSLGSQVLYANFVSSVDGVVAVKKTSSASSLISANSIADRFLIGLLRALADAVLVGAGTLRATPRHRWTAQHVYPPLAADFARLRRRLRRDADPRLVVLTSSGDLDPSHPALQAGALVLTTEEGARRAAGRLPGTCRVQSLSRLQRVDMASALDLLRAEGYAAILSEAGPLVMGQLVRARLVDDLFLTLSPFLAGRRRGDGTKSLAEGVPLLPDEPAWMRLVDVRRHDSHLFLRYQRA